MLQNSSSVTGGAICTSSRPVFLCASERLRHRSCPDRAAVDLATTMPIPLSSPRMRGEPQNGLAEDIRRMKSRTSLAAAGRPGFPDLVSWVQCSRNLRLRPDPDEFGDLTTPPEVGGGSCLTVLSCVSSIRATCTGFRDGQSRPGLPRSAATLQSYVRAGDDASRCVHPHIEVEVFEVHRLAMGHGLEPPYHCAESGMDARPEESAFETVPFPPKANVAARFVRNCKSDRNANDETCNRPDGRSPFAVVARASHIKCLNLYYRHFQHSRLRTSSHHVEGVGIHLNQSAGQGRNAYAEYAHLFLGQQSRVESSRERWGFETNEDIRFKQ